MLGFVIINFKFRVLLSQQKGKALQQQVMKTQEGGSNVGVPSLLWHSSQLGRLHFTPK
jgi:hypothetical protein